ncbi:MAG: LytR/AlgR family response regulator transcription factor [Flavobacteriales bacterium]
MKIVIIEDEKPAASRLQKLIEQIDTSAEIIRIIDSVEETVEFLNSKVKADLLFMDIQLADGMSFDIFKKVEVKIPVIFTTAFDNYALQAFKVNSIDYLLKPVAKEELQQALLKLENLRGITRLPDYDALLHAVQEKRPVYRQRFLVKAAGKLAFVPLSEIAYLFSDDGNSFLVTFERDRFLIDHTLEDTEAQLDPTQFFRISRKMILNLNSILRIEPHFNNRFSVELNPPFDDEVIVSRQRSVDFKSWLDR